MKRKKLLMPKNQTEGVHYFDPHYTTPCDNLYFNVAVCYIHRSCSLASFWLLVFVLVCSPGGDTSLFCTSATGQMRTNDVATVHRQLKRIARCFRLVTRRCGVNYRLRRQVVIREG